MEKEIRTHYRICQLRSLLKAENMDSSLNSAKKEFTDSITEVYEIWVPRGRLKQLFFGRGVDPQIAIVHYGPGSATLITSGEAVKDLLSRMG